jgi:hypothetical protein
MGRGDEMNSRSIALVIAFLLVPVPVSASTALALDLAALARAADEIVVVEVVGLRAEPFPGGAIVTRVTALVERRVAGRTVIGEAIDVIVPGGELDGLGMLVHGAPRLEPGGRYLLFLRRVSPEYQVVGLAQGAMPLRRSAATGEEVVTTPTNLPGLVREVRGRLEPASPAVARPTPLEQVVVRIDEARHGR